MATKSRVRKKNGKPVKYKAKPKGLSKTKMSKLLEMIQEQQKSSQLNNSETPEIRENGELLISPDFIKKLNVSPIGEINKGPELSEGEEEKDTDILEDTNTEKVEENKEEGPISSEI
jgi:hypothetical protein